MIYVTIFAMYIATCAVTTVYYPTIKLAKQLGISNTFTRHQNVSLFVMWALTFCAFPLLIWILFSKKGITSAIEGVERSIYEEDTEIEA